ncbi:cytochrome c oxidase assembly protein COX18, mitochondrial-like [Syngnathus typhle]
MLNLGSLHILRLPVRAWCGCALAMLHASLATGGTLWFPDLTSPDSTWLLLLALGLTNLFIVELFSLQRSNVLSVHKAVTNAMRMLTLLMIPVAAAIPSVSFPHLGANGSSGSECSDAPSVTPSSLVPEWS